MTVSQTVAQATSILYIPGDQEFVWAGIRLNYDTFSDYSSPSELEYKYDGGFNYPWNDGSDYDWMESQPEADKKCAMVLPEAQSDFLVSANCTDQYAFICEYTGKHHYHEYHIYFFVNLILYWKGYQIQSLCVMV